jgi:hypothetical protein
MKLFERHPREKIGLTMKMVVRMIWMTGQCSEEATNQMLLMRKAVINHTPPRS